MSKTWLVLKNEFISVVTRRSFILTLILIPLTGFIITMVISAIQKSTGSSTDQMMEDIFMPDVETTLEGVIDSSGLVNSIPEMYSDKLTLFTDEESAKAAIEKGQITAYYLIDKNYITNGEIIYVRPDFNPLGSSNQSGSIDDLMIYSLTKGDTELAYRVMDPINVTEKPLSSSTTPERSDDNPMTFILPYIVTFLFYIVILTSSSMLLNNISIEKQNRMMEILVTSLTPTQILTGKIIALGLAGLLQTVVWSGAGFLLLDFSGKQFALGDAFKLSPTILIWGIIFFLLGYAVYASMMAGLGALVPNLKEASQTTTVLIMPLIIPLMFISVLIQTPDSPISIFLSLFPLTSPVTMMTRLAATSVPFWQSGLAAVLLAGTAFLFVRGASKLFHAQNLLTGQTVNAVTLIKAFLAK